jgi:ketosteroid isomerase-like protein
MHRLLAVVAVGLALAAATTAGASAAPPAQDATPVAGLGVPGPEECRVEPRSLASLQALATPRAGGRPPTVPSGTPVALPEGEPADAETVAGITATIREFLACVNAGDQLRAFALYSDDFLRPFFGQPGTFTPENYARAATPQPIPTEEWRALVDVRDARVLADGRVGAVVVVDDPTSEDVAGPAGQTRDTSFVILVKRGDRWLVDGAIDDIPGEETGTPVP